MKYWTNTISKHSLLVILLFYFLFYLINLTLLPIFVDESIYLDWGWSNTHLPGAWLNSLLDAKQPLIIWAFGIMENFFSDPLFAGRFVSVIIGTITLIGIYQLTINLLGKKTAFIAALLYSLTPIFVFYNRQALMEAAVACTGIWAGYATLALIQKRTTRNGLLLGIVFGLGFLIKTSALIFIITSSAVILWHILVKKQADLLKPYLYSIFALIILDSILFIDSTFWQTFSSNSRYSYSPLDIFTTPVTILHAWIYNFSGFLQIGFFFVTPLVFTASLIGLYLIFKRKLKNSISFLVYFCVSLLLEILAGKQQAQRYLSPFLPFLIISAAYTLTILWQSTLWKKLLVVISFLPPLIMTIMIIFAPYLYIQQLSKISRYSDTGYISGGISGYGINETMAYINDHASQSNPNMVLFGLNIGNPESAVDLYSNKSAMLFPFHIDSSFFPNIYQYNCFTSHYPVFFVTRDGQMVGLDRFFTLAKSFYTPDKVYAIKIYILNKNCKGKSVSLSELYQPEINAVQQLK